MATDATPDESVDPVDPVESVELVLVRHGQSVWNAVRRWQGTADPPLTDLGREQARAQADWLAGLDETWAGVWTSPLRRAATTAEIIATRLGLPAPIVDQRLEEAYAGEWEGMTPAEIERDWPGYLTRNARPPSFEPDPIVRERAWSSLSDVVRAAAGRGSALVVTHSGLMRRVSELHGFGEVAVPNLGGYRLVVEPDTNRHRVTALEVFEPMIATPPRPNGGAHVD